MVVDIFGQFEVQKGDLAGKGFRKFAGGKSVPDPEGKVIHTDGEQGTINILDDVTAQLGVVLDCMVNKKSKGNFCQLHYLHLVVTHVIIRRGERFGGPCGEQERCKFAQSL